jgi:hypothetical protein
MPSAGAAFAGGGSWALSRGANVVDPIWTTRNSIEYTMLMKGSNPPPTATSISVALLVSRHRTKPFVRRPACAVTWCGNALHREARLPSRRFVPPGVASGHWSRRDPVRQHG